jgi:hypothetical protein
VGHFFGLLLHGFGNVRMVVAMASRPPGGNTID